MSIFTLGESEYVRELLKGIPVRPPRESVADYVEGRRVMPRTSAIPGLWRWGVTPYGREIVDCLSPHSGVEKITILKGRKLGFTTFLENVCLYYLFENPAPVMYATATEALAQDFAQLKLDPAIDGMGMRKYVALNASNRKKRRTGDTDNRKETLMGGVIDVISHQSKIARRQKDVRVLLIDEIDAAPSVTASGEGYWLDILHHHTDSFGARRKICQWGSPTTYDASLTWAEYSKGDRRRFLVPCPYCGELLELKLDLEPNSDYGLKEETKGGEIVDAYYLCEHCREPIYNNQKLEMYSERPRCRKFPDKSVEKYRWEPTAKAVSGAERSYYINVLYSPIGSYSFKDVAVDRRNTLESDDPQKKRSYVNIDVGMPYRMDGSAPKLNEVAALRGEYRRGRLPLGVIFLTVGVDVQKGSARKTGALDAARLETVVLGHGLGYRTWVIDHTVYYGTTDDAYEGAWADLYKAMTERRFEYARADGKKINPELIFFDSGNAAENRADAVFRFCGRIQPIGAPIKGAGNIKTWRQEQADVPGSEFLRRYRVAATAKRGDRYVEVSTWFYKKEIMNAIRTGSAEKAGGLSLPYDFDDEEMAQLCGTERLEDGSFKDTRAHVEVLDCLVYALCARDFCLDGRVADFRNLCVKMGASPAQAALQINSRTILELLSGAKEEKDVFSAVL
jgi:phage terminase large subunit GpA-like protein